MLRGIWDVGQAYRIVAPEYRVVGKYEFNRKNRHLGIYRSIRLDSGKLINMRWFTRAILCQIQPVSDISIARIEVCN